MAVNSVALILFGLFLLLGAFMLFGWLINLALKKKVINGAKFYLIAVCILFVIHLIAALNIGLEYLPAITIIGLLLIVYIPPVLVALFLTRKFNKNNKVLNENS